MADNDLQVDYEAVLNDLRARRDALDAAIAAIEPMVKHGMSGAPNAARKTAPKAPPPPPGSGPEILSDTFFSLSVPDATRKYLSMMKRPQSVPDIAKALEKGGFIHNSQNLTNTVGAVLHKIDAKGGDIRKVSRGVYGLSAWYGRKVAETPIVDPDDET